MLEQQLGEVGAVLAGDAGDQGDLLRVGQGSWLRSRVRVARRRERARRRRPARCRRAARCGRASRARAGGRRRAACAACRRACCGRRRCGREADDVHHQLGELGDRQVVAGADVDAAPARRRRAPSVHAGVGEVVDVEELAPRRAAAPDDDLVVAARLAPRAPCGSAPAARGCSRGRSCRPGRRGWSASR